MKRWIWMSFGPVLLAMFAGSQADAGQGSYQQAGFVNGFKGRDVQVFYSMGNRPGDKDTDLRWVDPGKSTGFRFLPGAAQQAFVIVPDGSGQVFRWPYGGEVYTLARGLIYYKSPRCRLQAGDTLYYYAGEIKTQAANGSWEHNCAGYGSGGRVDWDAPPDFPFGGVQEGRCQSATEDLVDGKPVCRATGQNEPPCLWAKGKGYDYAVPGLWWVVDLGGVMKLSGLRFISSHVNYKRGTQDYPLQIDLSHDGQNWTENVPPGPVTYINNDTGTLRFSRNNPPYARFVRVLRSDHGRLDVSQIYIYGCATD